MTTSEDLELIDVDWVQENFKRETHCFVLPILGFFLYQNKSGLLDGLWTIFFVEEDGDEETICHVSTRKELSNVLRVMQANLDATNALVVIRDNVLHQRGPMAEAGFDSDKVNAVLGVIDDAASGLDTNLIAE